MKAMLRIFKYCRKRIIKLSIENRQLKQKIEFLQAIIQSHHNIKH
jgi:hypothetical protein